MARYGDQYDPDVIKQLVDHVAVLEARLADIEGRRLLSLDRGILEDVVDPVEGQPLMQLTDVHAFIEGVWRPGDWVEPTLLNSWSNAGAPFDDIAYRYAWDGEIEFKGHITGGADGTVAFTLDADYRPAFDLSLLTDVVTGATPTAAQIYIEASSGDVIVTLL